MTVSAPLLFSIISPVYQAEETVAELVQRIKASVGPLTEDYEIILVDDRSTDNSWEQIQLQVAADARVQGLRLSRNFGQHHAITAGLDRCRGQWIIVLDCDLQDRPEEIPALFDAVQGGFDVVLGRRVVRQDAWHKVLVSRVFYRALSYFTGSAQDASVANFGIYHQKVIRAVLSMRESIRYFPTMVRWVGFRVGYLEVSHAQRAVGRSSYGLAKRMQLALDILLAYSDKPLRLTVKLGLLLSGGAFLFIPITVLRYWFGQISQPGYTSLIISIWFFAGLLLSVLGMVGLYIGKTFEQVKNRPLYIVDEAAMSGQRA